MLSTRAFVRTFGITRGVGLWFPAAGKQCGSGTHVIHRSIAPGSGRMALSGSAASIPKHGAGAASKPAVEEGWSLRMRLGFFSVFVSLGGIGVLSYELKNNEEMLFYMHDNYPWVITTLGPYIGLPIVESSGLLDEEEYFPRDVTELVGDTIFAAVKLRSGRVVMVQAPSETSNTEVEKLVCQKLGVENLHGDGVASVSFMEEEEESVLASKSDEELQEAFAIKFEPLPTPGSVPRAALEALLNVYRMNELELKTQTQLGKNHGFDYSKYEAALEELEQRKIAVKEMLKTAPK